MYYPVPESVNHSKTETVSRPSLPCGGSASTKSATVTFSVPKSSTPLMKKDNFVLEEVIRPTGGEWSKIKKSGSIKMTEMSIKSESILYDVGQVTIPYIKWSIVAESHVALPPKCKPCNGIAHLEVKPVIVKGRYTEQGDIDYWKAKYPNAPHYQSGVATLDTAQVEAAKSEVYADLFQSYNLGEEIAELRETISGVTKLMKEGVSLLVRSRETIRKLSRKGLTNEASSRWMEFRYGIMPILYSIQDILAAKQEGCYATVRKKVHSEVEVEHEYGDSFPYFETVGVSELTASITAKARWQTEDLKNFDRINVNPLTTFTAVLPWSMVIRWFFNVQSYLDARIKSLTSLALEHRACVAIRERRELGTYLVIAPGYSNTKVFWNGDCPLCGKGFYGYHDFGTYGDILSQRVLLSWESRNNYTRYLFQPSDVKLVYNPYLTWQRAIDALVMAKGPMSKLLRRLK